MVLLSPWAVVAMAGSETSLSWFFLGELLPVLFLALVLSRGGIISGWWRGVSLLRCQAARVSGAGEVVMGGW